MVARLSATNGTDSSGGGASARAEPAERSGDLRGPRWGPVPKLLLMVGLVLAGMTVLWFRHNAPPGKLSKSLPIDLMFYHYPMMEYASERLAKGELPLWNPYQCCGVPFLATTQVGVFYPGLWLAAVIPLHAALKTRMFCEVFLGGLFAALFFRSLGKSHFASGIGGILFIFACILGQTRWPPEVSTIMWIPFLFLCVERFLTGGNWKWWAAFTLGATLQLLAGFPQFLVYGFYLLGPYALVRVICQCRAEQHGKRRSIKRCAVLALGCVLAPGLAGVQMLPSVELVNNSIRAEGLEAEQIEYLDKRTDWRPLTVSRVLGNAFDPSPKWVSFDLSYGTGYVGIGLLFVIGLAIVGGWRKPLTWFFLITAAVSLVLSFGYQEWSGWLYKVYAALPTGGMFRTPSRFRLLTFFSLISLAVFGIDQFRTGFGELRRSRWGLGVAGLVVVGLLVATVWHSSWLGIAIAFATVSLLAGSFLLYRYRLVLIGVQSLLLLLLVFDVAHATGAYGVMRDIPVKWGQCLHYRAGKVMEADGFADIARAAGYNRVCMYNLRPVKPTRPLRRAYTICDFEPMLPARWAEASRTMKGSWRRPMHGVNRERFAGFYDMAGVKFFVTAVDTRRHDSRRRVWRGNRMTTWAPKPAPPYMRAAVYPNEDALPRAYLVGRFELCEPQEALSRVEKAAFDYRSTVLLEKDPGMASSAGGGNRPATIVSYAPERVVLQTDCNDERILVLTDTYFPGWKAFVDGAETEVLRANYLFRAVRVPPGEHRVVFDYRPASFKAGLALSGTSLVVFVVLCAAGGFLSGRRRAGR